jgi:hypothetical protein
MVWIRDQPCFANCASPRSTLAFLVFRLDAAHSSVDHDGAIALGADGHM